jgi:glycosyltransferase involved in cell wall biosynthesis
MRILIFHGYLLRGTGSNIYNANLARTLAGLGHEVDLFCQDRTLHEPEGVTIHVPDIGRVLPVYVADRYEGFDALPFPELDDAALGRYLDANVAAVRAACAALPLCARHSGMAGITATLAPALPEELRPLLSFEIGPGAVEEIAAKLVAWLTLDEAERKRASLALAKEAARRYSWENVAEGVIAAAQGRLDKLPSPVVPENSIR